MNCDRVPFWEGIAMEDLGMKFERRPAFEHLYERGLEIDYRGIISGHRRWGKTFGGIAYTGMRMIADKNIFDGVWRDERPTQRSVDVIRRFNSGVMRYFYITPEKEQGERNAGAYVEGLLGRFIVPNRNGVLYREMKGGGGRGYVLSNGSVLEILSGRNAETKRGGAAMGLVFDEIGSMTKDVYAKIIPMVQQTHGFCLVMGSWVKDRKTGKNFMKEFVETYSDDDRWDVVKVEYEDGSGGMERVVLESDFKIAPEYMLQEYEMDDSAMMEGMRYIAEHYLEHITWV